MNSDRIDELIALAALGELSESERRELDVAALSDPIVADDLDAALAAAAAIQRPHAEQPPAALRNSVLSAIASTPQEDAPSAPIPAPATAPVVSLAEERERRRIRPAILAGAAAVALFVAGGLVLVAQNDDPSDPIAAVVEAPDASSRRLDGEISLTAVYSPSEGALVIQGESVPVLDDTETYQLWLVGDDGATSVGIFRPDADGRVSERFADADPTGFVIGVTEEPAGGSESPTLPILASA